MHNRGLTLVELMTGVALVAVLLGIAIPLYQSHVAAGRRADAQAALMGLAQAMERQLAQVGTYNRAGGGTNDITAATVPTIFPSQAPLDGTRKFYDLRIMSATKTSYVIRAIPIAATAQQHDGFIEFSSAGVKSWDRNNDGAIAAGGAESCWAKQC
jgi:type IV pilus assembly protein PilE